MSHRRNFFGKREVFIKLNGYNKKVEYSEDSVFWKKAIQLFRLKKLIIQVMFITETHPEVSAIQFIKPNTKFKSLRLFPIYPYHFCKYSILTYIN
jgi:hypothetical protein